MQLKLHTIGISLLAIFYPFLDFLTINKTNIEPLQIKILFFILILLISAIFLISLILTLITKIKITKLVYFFSIFSLFLFFYQDLKNLLNLLLKSLFSDFNLGGETSIIIIIAISIFTLFTIIDGQKNFYLRFLNIFVILLTISSISKVFPLNLELKDKKMSSFSNEAFFSAQQIKEIKRNENKNIYYIIFDAAIPFESFNANFQNIKYEENIKLLKEKNYIYLNDVKSSYDGTHLTLSQMLNLNYHIDDKTGQYELRDTYAEIMRRFDLSPLGKILDEINYDFYWIGNASQNCYLYNYDLCIENYNKNYNLSFRKLLNYFSKILNNYTVSIFLERSPLIDVVNKVFLINYNKLTSKEIAFKENDSVLKFIDSNVYDNITNKKTRNKFILIHALMPHGYAAFNREPNIYGSNCESLSFEKYKNLSLKGSDKTNLLTNDISGALIGYDSNYKCFLKRLNQIVTFIDNNDPNSVVVITSDHGINFNKLDNTVFFASKFGNNCNSYVNNKNMDQINGIRLSLTCATNQKVDILEKRTFKRKMIEGKFIRVLEEM
tara:strand:+ start:1420 stop:3072 length:1653 start_codon:yes stop_codon:yes gene_type:complete